jgi:two-component system chemotaxis sensor kinase CheA
MDREREAVRRVTAANLHRLTAVPEFNHLVRSLDSIDRGIHWLTRRARRLCMAHKRHSLTLESCGRQLQRDVRHARMVTAESVFPGLRKTVRDLAKEEGKQVELVLEGFDVRADRMVFQALKDPLFHMLRNCISHGIETPDERAAAGKSAVGRVGLRMETTGNRLVIDVEDDGRGLDTRRIAARAVERGLVTGAEIGDRSIFRGKSTGAPHDVQRKMDLSPSSDEWSDDDLVSLIFQPGFSTSETVTEIAGRGMGLSVVQEAAGRLQGDVAVHRNDAGGTRFRLSVPLSVSTHRLLLVCAGEGTYALPVLAVDRLLRVKVDDLETIEGKPVITFRDQPVPLVSLAHVLGQNGEALTSTGKVLHVAVLKSGTRRLAVSVDDFLAERELLIQDLDEFAARKEYFGAVLLNDGGAALVLNPTELLKRSRPAAQPLIVVDAEPRVEKRSPRVLVVDDSFTTRTLEKSILEANGYEVAIAVDGVEGLSRLKCEPFDLVISDIEMPRMDGFSLLEAIKQDARLSSTPVILVTSRDRPEDRERGLDLGADAYIVKQRFDHQSLLETIRQIVDV